MNRSPVIANPQGFVVTFYIFFRKQSDYVTNVTDHNHEDPTQPRESSGCQGTDQFHLLLRQVKGDQRFK